MHPFHHAASHPEKAACVIAETGETTTYAQLDQASNRGAHLLRALGLQRGDVVAVMLDNEAAVFEISWAAQRSGVYLTSLSTRLSPADAAYILADSEARLLIVSDRLAPMAMQALQALALEAQAGPIPCYTVHAPAGTFQSWRESSLTQPETRIPDESPGTDMLYSSGTTGRPKGVKPPLPEGPLDASIPLLAMGQSLYGMAADSIYLSTSPLYHAAPLRWAMTIQRLGGTVVIMTKFDPEQALQWIERYHATHSTWVPTHFTRLLRLPDDVRARYDHSSLKAAIHAAAPCPVPIKQAMIDWWGPIIYEYYSGTETCGITALDAEEWLRKPGSVGRAVLGAVKIVGEDGQEVPTGQTGDVYFADGPRFEYHKDPEKTARAYNDRGWATLGDIGHLDADGYLFLTDRRNFMIISGGVNIYPQEIENVLVSHPKVSDVAVIGEPDDEMGEIVVAVVQLEEGNAGDAALASELLAFVKTALGGVKTPKRVDFCAQLPREATGKLIKAKLISEYRSKNGRPPA